MPDRPYILLIDDDAVDRAGVRRALRSSGIAHELVEASGGVEGLRLARTLRIDCVLLDYRLPDADAEDLLAELVSPGGGGHAVVVLTGEADQDVALRLMSAGALDYLAKSEATPFSLARAIRYAQARRAFVSELEHARLDAEEKSRALASLNRQKTLLLSVIAHDLRNPFQSLLGLSALLSQDVDSKDAARIERRARSLHEAADQAYALMESLFAWASLQMDAIDVPLTTIDIDAVAKQTLEGVEDVAKTKGIELTRACNGLHVRAHPDMLSAVLRNLVSNAIKFSHPGGRVAVAAETNGSHVEISIRDEGVGIESDKIGELFDIDRRATTIGTAGERGGGLGLLLCQDLIERQEGRLGVTSTFGKGATFSVTLLKADADLSEMPGMAQVEPPPLDGGV